MYVIVFAVALDQHSTESLTDLGKHRAKRVVSLYGQDVSAVLGHEDQVDMKGIYTVSSLAEIV